MVVLRGALVLALLLMIALPPNAVGVYGGTDAPEGAYPFMVHLFVDEPHDGLVCGGFLISPTHVLTAGHCVVGQRSLFDGVPLFGDPYTVEDMRALIGRTDLGAEGGEIIPVKAAYQHPDYQVFRQHGLTSGNDIAILELAEPSSHPPVAIATAADTTRYPGGTFARVIGWGCMDGETTEICFPEHLQQVDVPIWSDADCEAAPQYTIRYHAPTEICAGSAGKDACGGDSGGPLFLTDVDGAPLVVGIVAYGPRGLPGGGPLIGDCGNEMHPGVYTEVAAYDDFISSVIGGA